MILQDHPYIDRLIIPSHISGTKKYYLYAHIRQDNGDCFYIGIGTKFRVTDYDRAINFKARSEFWKRIINKTRYNVIIVDESDDKECIINKEIQYILILGKRKDDKGTLVNITDGGEGLKGHSIIWTDEMRKAASERLKTRVITEKTRQKLRDNIKKRSFYGKSAEYNSKAIIRIDSLTKEVLEEYKNSKYAADMFNVKSQSINSAIRKGYTCAGFKWEYKDKEEQAKINNILINKSKKARKKCVNPNSILIQAENILTNERINFSSLREAGKFINVHHLKIKDACINNTQINNYIWRYGNN